MNTLAIALMIVIALLLAGVIILLIQGRPKADMTAQRLVAGMELAADDGPEAAVLIGKIVIKGLPGDAQLMAQVGNADGRIGPLMEILQKTVFNLFLTAVGGCGTGNLCIIHVSHL